MDKTQNEHELAQATLEFMKRVDLRGGEVPAFVAVHNWLQGMVDAGTSPMEFPKEVKDGGT